MGRIISCCVMVLFFTGIAYAAEPIPRSDFIKITEEVLGTLDEIETIFSDSSSRVMEAKYALRKFDIAEKKYHRYVKSWPEGSRQGEIAWAMRKAWLNYDMALSGAAPTGVAKMATQEARDLFAAYQKHKK